MAESSRPWQGTTTGDAGPYSSDQWHNLQREMVGVGGAAAGAANAGILWGSGANPDPGLTVSQNSPLGQSVLVSAGGALIYGIFYFNSGAPLALTVAANASGSTRIDTVVLRADWALQTVRLAVKQGTPAGSPVPPGMTQTPGTLYEIPLADLTLVNGYTQITNADIVRRLNYKNVAPLDVIDNVQNASGVTTLPGYVAVWAASGRQVTTSAVRGAPVAGVWMDRVANGGYGRLLRRGIYPVQMSAAVTDENISIVHDANHIATPVAAGQSAWNAFAKSLEITAGAGACLCYVDVLTPAPKAVVHSSYNQPEINSGSTVFADIDGTNIRVTIVTNTGNVKVRFTVPIYFNYTSGTAWIHFNMSRDGGAASATTDIRGIAALNMSGFGGTGSAADAPCSITVEHEWTGLTPGTHYFTLQWKAILGTATAPNMGVRAYNATGGHAIRMSAIELDGNG